ncbi:AI-2E family transporter [Blastococcus xanthinilyticus]|nr:AI-2E family transporter [Blastococcus xanthinilyticus]
MSRGERVDVTRSAVRPETEPDGASGTLDTHPLPTPRPAPVAPRWAIRVLVTGAAVLMLAALGWLVFWFLLRLPLLTVAVAVALLLTAVVRPVTRWLHRRGLGEGISALLSVLLLLGVLLGVGFLVGFRAADKLRNLTRPLTAGIDRIRVWLTEGPLGLNPQQVTEVRNTVVNQVYSLTPEPAAAARMAVYILAAIILVAFLTFFLLKDGAAMWAWMLRWVPDRRRDQVDGAGQAAWTVLSQYVRGVVIVAVIDAVGIGAVLVILGVPLWLSLTLLTFLGAFVPLFGATVSGAVAVLVTLVTNGVTDAVIVLIAVLVVQQVEGNVLHPIIVGRTVRLHPVVVLLAVTAGSLLWGLAGALLAVPLVAVTYRVLGYFREHPAPGAGQAAGSESAAEDPPGADPGTVAEPTGADARPAPVAAG